MITIAPGQNIQSIINGNLGETVFQLQDGRHQLTSMLTLRAGLTLQGQSRGAILTGAKMLHQSTDASLAGWVADGSTGRFSIGGQTQQGTVNVQSCLAGFPRCYQPEDLWINGVLQIPQAAVTDVNQPGRWFFDYTNDRIYIFGSPVNKEIETSAVQKAIRANVDNCTIFRMTIEKFSIQFQAAAIQADDGGDNWLLEDLLGRHCHGQAFRVGQGWQLRNSRITECGQLGLGGGGTGANKATGILIENVEIDHCGVSGVQTGFAGGAMKITNSRGATMKDSYVHDNPGNGIWWDIDNEDTLTQGCRSEDNKNQGIFQEIGFRGRILNCTVKRCGFGRTNNTGFGAGIFIAATVGVEVANCLVEDCHNGICATQQDRGSGQDNGVTKVYVVRDLYVHDNQVILKQTNGDVQHVGLYVGWVPPGASLYDPASNNRFRNNVYNLVNAGAAPFRWNNQDMTLAQWRAAGQDVVTGVSLQPGQWRYDAGTSTLYVRCTDDGNPNTKKMVVFDQRFATEEIVWYSTGGALVGRLCRHFSYVGDAAGVDRDAARGASMSYDGSRVVFSSNRGGGPVGVYAVLTDPRL